MKASVVRLTRSPSAAWAAMMWQTASGTPHSSARATPVKGWRRASPRSLWRLLPSGPISYSSSLPTSARIAPAITVSRSIGKARPMKACMAWALSRAMCTTQRLCSMKVMGQFGTSRVKGIWFRSSAFSGLRSSALIQVWVTCSRSWRSAIQSISGQRRLIVSRIGVAKQTIQASLGRDRGRRFGSQGSVISDAEGSVGTAKHGEV